MNVSAAELPRVMLPVGSGLLVHLPHDEAALAQIARSAFVLGGWKEIERIETFLRDARLGLAKAIRYYRETKAHIEDRRVRIVERELLLQSHQALLPHWARAVRRLRDEIRTALQAVERTARRLGEAVLAMTTRDIRKAKDEYLGSDGKAVDPSKDGAARLLEALGEIAAARAVQDAAAERWTTLQQRFADELDRGDLTVDQDRLLAAAAGHETVARARIAALVDLHAERHPVLYRIAARDPADIAGSTLLHGVLDDVGASVTEVAELLEPSPAGGLSADDPSPISTLGEKLDGAWQPGPWQYPMLIEEALQDLYGTAPAVGRTATREVLRLAGLGPSFAESAAITATLAAVAVAAPPVALAVGIAMSTNDVVLAVRDYRRKAHAANVAFDPALGLLPPPSGGELVFRVAGAVADVLPGKIAGTVSILAPLAAGAQE